MKSVIIITIAVVLITSISITSIYAQAQSDIPAWVKNNAIWWGEDKISDSEFLSALQFLINNGNLKVANSSEDLTELEEELQSMRELKDSYQQTAIELKEENNKLKKEIESQNSQESSQSSSSNLSVQELKNQAISWNYKDIIRNEGKYIGKIIYVEGSIWNVDERTDSEDWVLLSVHTSESDYGIGEDLMYIWYGNPSRLLYEDTIESYIVVDEVYSQESMLQGNYIYTPLGTAKHVTCTSC